MSQDTVVIPPGHQVVIVKPRPDPWVGSLPSGLLLLEYGRAISWRESHSSLDSLMSQQREASVIVILQEVALDRLEQHGHTQALLEYWQLKRQQGVNAVWVFPLAAAKRHAVIQQVKALGFGAHESAADGASFVEVHKPDGTVTVGMPGPAIP